MQIIKSEVKDGFPEDAGKKRESDVEGIVKKYADDVQKLVAAKEADVMKV